MGGCLYEGLWQGGVGETEGESSNDWGGEHASSEMRAGQWEGGLG